MLGLIAGSGLLPREIAIAHPDDVLVCAYDGAELSNVSPDLVFRLETLGSLFNDLSARGVTRVCFAGGIARPVFDPSALDNETLPLVPELKTALLQGDDGGLRRVAALFEARGIAVVGAHELAPHLLPEKGVLTRAQPGKDAPRDIERARTLLQILSRADVGQSCVVAHGQILAVEAVFGTAWMLDSLRQRPDAAGGLFYKAPKAGQDRRFDLPVIGPETVDQAVLAGLDGIVIESGGVMVLDQTAVRQACDDAGLYLWVHAPGEA